MSLFYNFELMCVEGVLNQPQDTLKQVAFAKNSGGTIAVAYIPGNGSGEI